MSSPQNSSPNQNFQDRLNRVAEKQIPLEDVDQVDVLPDWKQNMRYPGLLAAVLLLCAVGYLIISNAEVEEAVAEVPEEPALPKVIRLN